MDVRLISVEQLDGLLGQGTTVFDVRQPHEYEAGHVPGAKLVPLAEVPVRVEEFPSSGQVPIICRSGARSLQAAEYLLARGIDAVNVTGGTLAWAQAGKPLVVGPQPS
jgi:rhodanese-related sulfurtransferase